MQTFEFLIVYLFSLLFLFQGVKALGGLHLWESGP